MHYVLINGRPTYEPDFEKWSEWFETSEQERVVHQTKVGEIVVSTVFIGLDYRLGTSNPPLIYETMIFDADGEAALGGYQQRYATLGDAKQGHWEVVEQIRAGRSA